MSTNSPVATDEKTAPDSPDDEYLPLPPIICRPLPMPTKHYVSKSWIATALDWFSRRTKR